jgi:DNA-binding beta-propeller fold protein YncE
MRTFIKTLALLVVLIPNFAYAQTKFSKITTIAGNGKAGPAEKQGAATSIPISNPFGIEPDSKGNLIIASFDQHVIYRLSADRKSLELMAGTGAEGMSGKTGDAATTVAMNQPHEVRVDPQDNIYIADTRNNRVGLVDPRGKWKAIAGTGEVGYAGDGGPAVYCTMNQAYSIAVDGTELFVADLMNHCIRKVDLVSGKIMTICGTGKKGRPVDGATASEQALEGPRSLAIDKQNLWIVLREGNSVWRIDRATGKIHHVAGSGQKGFAGDGADAKLCKLNGPKGAAVNPGIALYIADTENHAIRVVDLKTNVISTVVGSSKGEPGFNGDGDQPTTRLLKRPHGVCWLSTGELLIGDSENHRVRVLTP